MAEERTWSGPKSQVSVDYVSNFKEIDSVFYELLRATGLGSVPFRVDGVREFVDVGEYGIALRTYAAIFEEEKKTATAKERDFVQRLAVSMSMDPLPLLIRMNRADAD